MQWLIIRITKTSRLEEEENNILFLSLPRTPDEPFDYVFTIVFTTGLKGNQTAIKGENGTTIK